MPAARQRPTLLIILGVLSAVALLAALVMSLRPATAPELAALDRNATPLEQDMARWAVLYRQHFEPLVPHVDAIDNMQATRETCNALLVSVMNIERELSVAPDQDVTDAVATALVHFTTAAQACVRSRTREDVFERDGYVVLGRSSVGLVNHLLQDRYQLRGVPELDEPEGSAAALRMQQMMPK